MAQRKGKTPARKNINGIPLENDTTKSLEKYFQGNEGPTIQKTETSDLTPLHFNKQNKNGVTYTFQLKGIWEEQIIINYFNTFLISPSNKFLKNPQRCLICMACFYFSVHSINSPLKEKTALPHLNTPTQIKLTDRKVTISEGGFDKELKLRLSGLPFPFSLHPSRPRCSWELLQSQDDPAGGWLRLLPTASLLR